MIDPERLKTSIHQVGLYLTAWETFKSSVIDRVKGFYSKDWRLEDGELKGTPNADYKNKVIDLHPKDELHACCLWLKDSGAFTDDDIDKIANARRLRNSVGHEIRSFIIDEKREVDRDVTTDLYNTVKKLDIWWLTEVEMATDPELTEEMYEAARSGEAIGGYSFLLELILPTFDGDFEQLARIYQEIQERQSAKSKS